MRHAAVNVALGLYSTIALILDLGSRHRRSAAGEARVDPVRPQITCSRAAQPSRGDRRIDPWRPRQSIAISAGHASIGQPKRAPSDLLRRSRLARKSNGAAGLNVDIIGNYESPSQ